MSEADYSLIAIWGCVFEKNEINKKIGLCEGGGKFWDNNMKAEKGEGVSLWKRILRAFERGSWNGEIKRVGILVQQKFWLENDNTN